MVLFPISRDHGITHAYNIATPLPPPAPPHVQEADPEKDVKWVPPTNQSGDGTTHLNAKFGY